MHQLVFELATVIALSVAALVGATALWQGASVYAIAFRILISGGVVFFFTLLCGHLLGRSILEDIAQREMERKQRDLEERARREAAEGASLNGEEMFGSMQELAGARAGSTHSDGSSAEAA